jgi:4-hydroxythreonine-4-phosphate dehydrogenase
MKTQSDIRTRILCTMNNRPRLLLTMGDVAGIGPEIIARAWPDLLSISRPVVVGDPGWLRSALDLTAMAGVVQPIRDLAAAKPTDRTLPCLVTTDQDLCKVKPGQISAASGRAAYDFLCRAVDETRRGQADAIVTAPLHKEGLRAAGLAFPGHTEILAERTGTQHYGMVLYADELAVVHVTLHMALRDIFRHVTQPAVREKICLLNGLLPRLLDRPPRLAVAALNPHASDGGLFGDEEETILQPAVASARAEGINVSGPWPTDMLFVRARAGEFDGVVAMYHDQGHIALKLLGGMGAVNITVGLPLVRTSVAHGTAYDIAGRGVADPTSLVAAARVAAQLIKGGLRT